MKYVLLLRFTINKNMKLEIKELHTSIKEKMDGRTNIWLNGKTRISQSELSRILTGRLKPSTKQLEKINTALGTDFK
jgi:transcriptional regulator with XRE-family HTH domain